MTAARHAHWDVCHLRALAGCAAGDGGNTINYDNGLDTTGRAQPQGGFGGGQIGYNFQSGSFVYGVETDFQGAGITDSVNGLSANGAPFSSSERVDWFGTVRGRLGWAFGPTLVYATGGFAYGNVNQRAVLDGDTFASNTTQTGYTVGGGVEYKFNPAWSIKAEYQYIDLGNQKLTDGLGNSTNDLDTNFQTARVGLNYRFGGGEIVPLK